MQHGRLYAATDAGVDYSIDGDSRFLVSEDAAARAQFRMAGDAAARVASDSIYTPQPPKRWDKVVFTCYTIASRFSQAADLLLQVVSVAYAKWKYTNQKEMFARIYQRRS